MTLMAALRRITQLLANGISLAVASPAAFTCWLERRFSSRDELFRLWGHCFSLIPGLPGDYLRKGYYRLTLESCSMECTLEFLCQFTHRAVAVGEHVYVGVGARIATATLGEGCLIGSRTSILSGGRQHDFGDDGRLTPFDPERAQRVTVGANTWIGEGAILMADVGRNCIVSAGAVVSQQIVDGCIVAGNPCRLVGRTIEAAADPAAGGERTQRAS